MSSLKTVEYARYILAHLIQDPSLFKRAKQLVRESDFFIYPAYGDVWRETVISSDELNGNLPPIEYIRLKLILAPLYQAIGETGINQLIQELTDIKVEPGNKEIEQNLMRWLSQTRRHQVLSRITSDTPTSLIIEELQHIQQELTGLSGRAFLDPFSSLTGLSRLQVVPLGIKGFDSRITCGGVPKGRTVLILSGTSGGKTTILTNICVNTAKQRFHTLFITLEDPEEEIAARAYACAAQLPYNKLLFVENRLPAHTAQLHKLIPEFKNFIHIFDADKNADLSGDLGVEFTTHDLDATITEFIATGKPLDMVVIDYFNLIAPDTSLPENEQAKEVTRHLKRIARKHNIVLVVTAQTNRQGLLKPIVEIGDIAGFFSASWGFDYILGFGNAEEENLAQKAAERVGYAGLREEPIKMIMNIAKGKMMAKDKFVIYADFAYMTIREEPISQNS
jgi:replicative DNA helicase